MITTELISRQEDKRELPDGWRWVKLGDFVASYRNGFGRRPTGTEDGPIVLRLADVSNGVIDLSCPRRVSMSAQEIETYQLEKGDLLFVRVNGSRDLIGRCILVEQIYDKLVYNDHLIRVRLHEGLNPEYLKVFCCLPKVRAGIIKKATTSAGQLTINQEVIAFIPILLPPLVEQKRIVASLNEQMEAVERSRQATLAQLEAAKALPAAYFRAVFCSSEAREWKWAKFGESPLEIIDGDRGENYPKQSDFSTTGYCLFLNTGNVTTSGFNFSNCTFINQKLDAVLRTGRLQVNDVVLTTRGTVGNTAWFSETVPYSAIRINSGMVILRTNTEHLLSNFLCLFLRSPKFREQVLSLQSGTAQPQLPIRDLKRIELPLPPLPEQKRIAATLTEQMADVQKLCQSLQEQFDTINKLPTTLLRRAFNGEL